MSSFYNRRTFLTQRQYAEWCASGTAAVQLRKQRHGRLSRSATSNGSIGYRDYAAAAVPEEEQPRHGRHDDAVSTPRRSLSMSYSRVTPQKRPLGRRKSNQTIPIGNRRVLQTKPMNLVAAAAIQCDAAREDAEEIESAADNSVSFETHNNTPISTPQNAANLFLAERTASANGDGGGMRKKQKTDKVVTFGWTTKDSSINEEDNATGGSSDDWIYLLHSPRHHPERSTDASASATAASQTHARSSSSPNVSSVTTMHRDTKKQKRSFSATATASNKLSFQLVVAESPDQYVAIVEGIVAPNTSGALAAVSQQDRHHYLSDVLVHGRTDRLPTRGYVTELHADPVASGIWDVSLVGSDRSKSTNGTKSPLGKRALEKQSDWYGASIRLVHDSYRDVAQSSTTAASSIPGFVTVQVDPSSVASRTSRYVASEDAFVGALAVAFFDGFVSTTEHFEMQHSMARAILSALQRHCDNDGGSQGSLSALACIDAVTVSNAHEGDDDMATCSVDVSGGVAVPVNVDWAKNIHKSAGPSGLTSENGCGYDVRITTCDATNRVVAVEVAFKATSGSQQALLEDDGSVLALTAQNLHQLTHSLSVANVPASHASGQRRLDALTNQAATLEPVTQDDKADSLSEVPSSQVGGGGDMDMDFAESHPALAFDSTLADTIAAQNDGTMMTATANPVASAMAEMAEREVATRFESAQKAATTAAAVHATNGKTRVTPTPLGLSTVLNHSGIDSAARLGRRSLFPQTSSGASGPLRTTVGNGLSPSAAGNTDIPIDTHDITEVAGRADPSHESGTLLPESAREVDSVYGTLNHNFGADVTEANEIADVTWSSFFHGTFFGSQDEAAFNEIFTADDIATMDENVNLDSHDEAKFHDAMFGMHFLRGDDGDNGQDDGWSASMSQCTISILLLVLTSPLLWSVFHQLLLATIPHDWGTDESSSMAPSVSAPLFRTGYVGNVEIL